MNQVEDQSGVYAVPKLQSEAQLENNLIQQLIDQGYRPVKIDDEKDLLANLK